MRVGDLSNPSEAEARLADAEVRGVYEQRLAGRLARLKGKRAALLEEQMEAQQAFHRNRNPTPAQTGEHRASMERSHFKVSVVEERIVQEQGALAARMARFMDTLRADSRLQSVYDPKGYQAKLEREGKI